MGKTALCSLIVFIFICTSLVATVHAEEMRKPGKVIIDGVEYVPKGSENSNKKSDDRETPKQTKMTLDHSATYSDNTPSANLENFAMKGNYGLGLEVAALNFGIGPSAEYWFTDNIVAKGSFGVVGDFKSYGLRGDYVFDKPMKIYQAYKCKPYAGIGYTAIKGPEMSFGTLSSETSGSGFDIHAGLFMPAQEIYKNVALRWEVGYSTITLKTSFNDPSLQFQEDLEYGGYSSIGLGFGMYYFFN